MKKNNFNKNVNEAFDEVFDLNKTDKKVKTESFKHDLADLIDKYDMSNKLLSAKVMASLIIKIIDLFNWADEETKEEKKEIRKQKKIQRQNDNFWYD